MKGFWSDLPTWAKGVVAVVGVAAIGGIGFAIYKSVKNALEKAKEGKDDKEFKGETKEELQELKEQGIQPTLSDSQAMSLATFVETSLAGCELSGSEEKVYKAVLAGVNNQADWLKLQNTYGVRTTDNCGIGTGDSKQDLKGILMSDLDGFDWSFTLYSTKLRKGLEAKGIVW
jgi:hypothetical protein